MRQWTAEERIRQSQLIKNWQPWKQSTGPKTPEGKVAVSRNGYKGGLQRQLKRLSKMLKEQKQLLQALR